MIEEHETNTEIIEDETEVLNDDSVGTMTSTSSSSSVGVDDGDISGHYSGEMSGEMSHGGY